MSSDVKLERARKLDIACPAKVKGEYRGSSKTCQVVLTAQSRRYRSYSATMHRQSRDDDVDKKPTRKFSHQQSLTAPTAYSIGDRLKRRHGSFSAGCATGFKRRKKEPSGIVPPTKFLLGGNITDPLNLNSFVDEKPGSRQQTPDVSPRLPVPKERSQVEVLIPPNINDPLNLNGCDDDAELESILVAPKSKKRKRKNKKQKNDATDQIDSTSLDDKKSSNKQPPLPAIDADARCQVDSKAGPVEARSTNANEPQQLHQQPKHKKCDNKIVSPVIPQPGSTTTRKPRRPSGHARESDVQPEAVRSSRQRHRTRGSTGQSGQTQDVGFKFNPKNARFRYGNYNRYYGYRNPDGEDDYRLQCFKREWFEGKDVLDVGCNIGHITLTVARDFAPRKIVGVDIDASLVRIARRNVVHYLETSVDAKFPISLSICRGPIAVAATAAAAAVVAATSDSSDGHHPAFPNNVCFVEGNYVLESDDLLEVQREEFDTVVCLSITKWIHLNWGDDGLKRLFKRVFRQLRPGGRLILEPQAFAAYNKKKKLAEDILHNYENMKFMPEHFTEYLLSKEVGFSKCEVIDTPFNVSKGFRRPIQLFTKGGNTPTRTSPPRT